MIVSALTKLSSGNAEYIQPTESAALDYGNFALLSDLDNTRQ